MGELAHFEKILESTLTMIVFTEKIAEKFLLFLAVSPRNRQFTVCLFLPEARIFFFFTLTVQCKYIQFNPFIGGARWPGG